MGSYTFKWEHPATEVYVTGTFDNWGRSVQLVKEGDVFKKTVDLSDKDKVLYKFVVDGNWTTNTSAPSETDSSGNTNNVLTVEDIKKSAPVHTLSSAAPSSTTAALAGAVPKEGEAKPKEEKAAEDLPGAFPETPFETPAQEPNQFSVSPLPATGGLGGNPIHLAPGEKVPDEIKAKDINSAVESDTYDKPDALPGVKQPEAKETEANGAGPGLFGVPPVTSNLIPESSLPIGGDTSKHSGATDLGPTVQSAAPTSTTATLAGAVPKEPRGVPEVVTESQKEAKVDPEASASPEAVKEKKEVEQELLKEIKPAAATTESTATSAGAAEIGSATAVPAEVKESITSAKVEPEAAANPEAVAEKAQVEKELLKEVPKSNESGEPAPVATAELSAKAPGDGLSPDALADKEPLKSSSEGEIAPLDKPSALSVPPTESKPADSADVSPTSGPKKAEAGPSQPTVTTGVDTTTTDKKTEAPAAATTESKKEPETPKSKAKDTPATPSTTGSDAGKKKKRMSGLWGKIKEKLK